MSEHCDVLIIGGGVIGLTTAYFLSRDGVRVTLVDKGDFGQEASWAGAGIIPPGKLDAANTPIEQLRALSSARFSGLSEELLAQTGIDNGYRVSGGLVIVEDEAEAIDEWRTGGVECRSLAASELHALEPTLAKHWHSALHLPEMAQIRNPRHLKALVAGCRSLGARLHLGCPAFGFERRGNSIVGVRTSTGLLHADRYLLAAGAWTDPLLEQLGCSLDIRPVRGQIAMLNTGASSFGRILVHGKRYLVPRPDGRVLAGSTEEHAGFNKQTTAEAIAGLLAFATSLVPELGAAHLERCWAGLRPGSPDDLPFLGPVPGVANCFVAAGHYRAGLQLSPGTGEVMKAVLTGQEPFVPLDAFRLDRAFRT
jgi:glycine oxidase